MVAIGPGHPPGRKKRFICRMIYTYKYIYIYIDIDINIMKSSYHFEPTIELFTYYTIFYLQFVALGTHVFVTIMRGHVAVQRHEHSETKNLEDVPASMDIVIYHYIHLFFVLAWPCY